jgi:hypothetical protein
MTWNGLPDNPDVPVLTGVDHMRDALSLVSNSLYNAATYIAHNGNEQLAESHAKDAIAGWDQLKQSGASEQYAEAYTRGARDAREQAVAWLRENGIENSIAAMHFDVAADAIQSLPLPDGSQPVERDLAGLIEKADDFDGASGNPHLKQAAREAYSQAAAELRAEIEKLRVK